MKVLLLQKMDDTGMKILADAGLQVDIPTDTSEESLAAVAPIMMLSSSAAW